MSEIQEQVLAWQATVLTVFGAIVLFNISIVKVFRQLKELVDMANEKASPELIKVKLLNFRPALEHALKRVGLFAACSIVMWLLIARGAVFVRMANAYGFANIGAWAEGFWPRFVFYSFCILIILWFSFQGNVFGKARSQQASITETVG